MYTPATSTIPTPEIGSVRYDHSPLDAAFAGHHPGWNGGRRLGLASGEGRIDRRATGCGVGHRDRRAPGSAPAGRGSEGRPPSCARVLPDPGDGRESRRSLFQSRWQAADRALPQQADRGAASVASGHRVACRGQLRGSLPGEGRPRRHGRHQLPAQDRDPAPAIPLRRDARGCGRHHHRRRRPPGRPGDHRSTGPRRVCRTSTVRHWRVPRFGPQDDL